MFIFGSTKSAVILLCISATLFCVLFRRIFGRKVGLTGYIIFSCIFISNPIISEVYVYYYHDGVDIGYVFSALALICFWSGMDKWSGTRKSAIKYYLGSNIVNEVSLQRSQALGIINNVGKYENIIKEQSYRMEDIYGNSNEY